MELDIEILFNRYEYNHNNIALDIKNKIISVVRRF